ncbi:unnamed protein product [Gongylonema pulchrum]|uniref:Secreted protein n=1 Tax=Gongylonema pulchrum TaxID=637853 RepID=A0A183D3V7_9BILA|nr:unnamed protein product [Gongylonema pulchrum]
MAKIMMTVTMIIIMTMKLIMMVMAADCKSFTIVLTLTSSDDEEAEDSERLNAYKLRPFCWKFVVRERWRRAKRLPLKGSD